MTQQHERPRAEANSVPNTGLRGGLGRTLLSAFLILSIVPLSVISFVASTQARRSLQNELQDKLVSVAALADVHVHTWIARQQAVVDTLGATLSIDLQDTLSLSDSRGNSPLATPAANASQRPALERLKPKIVQTQQDNPALLRLYLVDADGSPILTVGGEQTGEPTLTLERTIGQSGLKLVAELSCAPLAHTLNAPVLQGNGGHIYLLTTNGQSFDLTLHPGGSMEGQVPAAIVQAALGGQTGTASYENEQGVPMIGAYRWMPDLQMALLVEQPQAMALDASDELAVVLIGATLGAALLTALIASAVTRRITLPIVELTATAVQIASGDLDQKVPTTRRDEIGILARAFNVMTTKLRILYDNLEQKVQERTHQLQEANAEIRYRATQLAISAEVGRVVTSILDRDRLLSRVVELIRDCFQAYFVAIYFVEAEGEWIVLREGTGGLGQRLKEQRYRIRLDDSCLLCDVVRVAKPQVCSGEMLDVYTDRQLFPHTQSELAVPLKIGERILGVLDVHSTHADAFQDDEVIVLETLAGQVSVAIENARAYEVERQAAEQLRELEKFRRRFLSNMSRELRMPLNNIIGFSRVILKGIDGPITELQRQDLEAIYESGQQLLALINDILDIAHIEAGEMELSMRPVNVSEIAHSVLPTANALLQDRPIRLTHDIPANVPQVMADPFRLRQVLVKLLSNAIKFTPEGEISLRVRSDEGQVFISIGDTGIGIPEQYRDKIFEMFNQIAPPQGRPNGAGLGLTISKEIVEMHGGTLTVESHEGEGTTFTIALPILEVQVGEKNHDQDNRRQ